VHIGNTVIKMLYLTGEDGRRVVIGRVPQGETPRYFSLIESLEKEAEQAKEAGK
jgi:hypothetical protein